MKAERFKHGHVFKYPYKWQYMVSKEEQPKERPVCMVLKIERPVGGSAVAIVPISDRPTDEPGLSLEVPTDEAAMAGLSAFRRAHVHVNELNLDRTWNSYSFNPNTRIMGRFSKAFTSRISRQLVDNIKNGRAKIIDRSQE